MASTVNTAGLHWWNDSTCPLKASRSWLFCVHYLHTSDFFPFCLFFFHDELFSLSSSFVSFWHLEGDLLPWCGAEHLWPFETPNFSFCWTMTRGESKSTFRIARGDLWESPTVDLKDDLVLPSSLILHDLRPEVTFWSSCEIFFSLLLLIINLSEVGTGATEGTDMAGKKERNQKPNINS